MSARLRSDHANPAQTSHLPAMRNRLLLPINLVCGILLVVLIVLEYRREVAEAVHEVRHSLEEQASLMHLAVLHLRAEHGPEAIQSFVDDFSARVSEVVSPRYHVVVVLEDGRRRIESRTHAADRGNRHAAMSDVDEDGLVVVDGDTYVVGNVIGRGVDVRLSESLNDVLRDARSHAIQRLVALAGLGVLAAAILNVVLLRVVARPVDRLVSSVERIGAGDLEVVPGRFATRELQGLANAVEAMRYALAEDAAHRSRQMRQARAIQEHLLHNNVDVPGALVASRFYPAEDVAGDFYLVKPLRDSSWLFCIADVTGHGIPAAMGATLLATILDHVLEEEHEPARIVDRVNRRLVKTDLPGCFPTMLIARWDPADGRLTYANAGHEPGTLFRHDGERDQLFATGTVLGVDDGQSWETCESSISGGELLFLSTDGLVEAADASGRMFGRDRLDELLDSLRGESASNVAERVEQSLSSHVGRGTVDDDVTYLVVEFVAKPTHFRPVRSQLARKS